MERSDAGVKPARRQASDNVTAARRPLRFVTCGSANDGKSTLIGRILYEINLVFADELNVPEGRSESGGSIVGDIDFALLVDRPDTAREHGDSVRNAYRNFSTPKRSFTVADLPGHEQSTRNMVSAAVCADLALLLVDARNGLQAQTFRHSIIVSMLGIRHVVLAVNKMDLVDYDQGVFQEIVSGFQSFAGPLEFLSLTAVPISARFGDNVSSQSERMPWYRTPGLISLLESIDVGEEANFRPFRMSVQRIDCPSPNLRGFAGTVASGTVSRGDEIVVAESGRVSRVSRIVTGDDDCEKASAGEPVTLVLADEIDIPCGSMLSHPASRPDVLDLFAAHLIWLADDELLPGRSYLMKIGARTIQSSVIELKHRIDVNTLTKLAAKTLHHNDIGFCNLAAVEPVAFDPYSENRETGSFNLIDRTTNATVAAGFIAFGLRRATNIHVQHLAVTKCARAHIMGQRPAVLWFTGLSGAGKSTIGNLVEAELHAQGAHTILLDGDNVRHGLNKDLGFTEADRVENIRRIGEVAKLMVEAGLIVLCSFISPFRAERRLVREMLEPGEFLEIFVDAPLGICIARDPKGLYKRALAGEIKNFTGIDQAYEPPGNPEVHLDTAGADADTLAHMVLEEIGRRGIYPSK